MKRMGTSGLVPYSIKIALKFKPFPIQEQFLQLCTLILSFEIPEYGLKNAIFTKKFGGHMKNPWRALFCPWAVVWPPLF